MNDKTTEQEQDPRSKQIADRKKMMKELTPVLPRVRVNPKDDVMRKALKHPNGSKFPADGSAEWPLDQFTRRRIKDGSVTREEAEQREERRRPAARGATPEPKPSA